ncbi:MAG: dethiobiotin synthase [Desulfobulbaceae bacterium]|nr:dethiobiotin synthase [Desulfobulbaceae bacterium]
MSVYVIVGIDTGIGKTIVTGLLGRYLLNMGKSVFTQKFIQTGCPGKSVDILAHREIMGTRWNELDEAGVSCPYTFSFPASPHLAAGLVGESIDPLVLDRATAKAQEAYEIVLIEGAGGLLVPLSVDLTLLDYFASRDVQMVLVTTPRLGSINHTLLSLEALRNRNIKLAGLVYNVYGEHCVEITNDSLEFFKGALVRYGFEERIVVLDGRQRERGDANWQVLFGR